MGPGALAAAAPPWHRFTVDRHLVEAAAAAAELTHDVDRPDLLLVAALLHDIGKGWPGDHSEVGEPIAAAIADAHGLLRAATSRRSASWCATTCCCRRPRPGATSTTPPPSTGSRRRSGTTPAVLQLLHALAQADGAATSASAWSPWKAHLVAALVARVQAKLGGGPVPEPEPVLHPTDRSDRTAATSRRRRAVTVGIEDVADGQQVTIGAPDRPGLLSICAGVLALNQLDVRAAKMSVEGGHGTGVFAVRPRFGRAPVPEILADGVRAALEGTLPLADRLRQREADYRQDGARSAPPRISWHNGEVSGAATGIVEVRAGDRAGLLYRLTAAIAGEGLDVTSARIETLGGDAVDSFYVGNPRGRRWTPEQRARVDARADGRHRRRRRTAAGGAPTRRGQVRGSVSGACDRRGARDGTVPLRRGGAYVDSRLWPCPHVWRDHRVRAAALRRRAHRRRRRVPRVGLRRLRLGRGDR